MESHGGAMNRALGLDSRLRGNDRGKWSPPQADREFAGVPRSLLLYPPRVGARGLKAWFRDKLVLVSLAYYGYD